MRPTAHEAQALARCLRNNGLLARSVAEGSGLLPLGRITTGKAGSSCPGGGRSGKEILLDNAVSRYQPKIPGARFCPPFGKGTISAVIRRRFC